MEAGLGATMLPRFATSRGPHPAIMTRPISSPKVTRTIGIIERRKGRLSLAAKYLRDLLPASGKALTASP
jgi:DNA-binding transcriptional LysR family regulator